MDGEVDEQLKTCDVLSLDSIRSSLIRQEETIIFALIERSQFRRNDIVYKKGGFGSLGVPPGSTPNDTEELSFMEYLLSGTEALHCQVRRYTSPEEHAFFPDRLPIGPKDCLPSLDYSEELLSPIGGASGLNYNKRLLKTYVNSISMRADIFAIAGRREFSFLKAREKFILVCKKDPTPMTCWILVGETSPYLDVTATE